MHHPFITNLSDKSIDDLQNTINDLSNKLNYVSRMQNGPMMQQMNMALDSYKTEYNKRIDELYKKQNLQSKINISKDQ